jgi:anti-anti-sigma factor
VGDALETAHMQPCDIVVDLTALPPLLKITGRLSADAVEDLEPEIERMLAAPPERLLIDLSGLTFIGSLGIGQLLMLCGRIAGAGGGAAIVATHPGVHEAFVRCRAEDSVTLCSTHEEASRVFAGARAR